MSLQRLQFDMFTAFYCQLAYSAAQFGARRVFYQWRQGPAANAARALPANALSPLSKICTKRSSTR